MHIINLGGYGGCTLTEVIRRFDQPAYPFDWNITSQDFVIKCILTNGKYYFNFDDNLVFETTILLSQNNDAYLCHDFKDWNSQKQEVKSKYERRINRLMNAIESTNHILFCRHLIDKDPYNKYSPCRIPFTREYDEIYKWENFMNEINKKRNGKTNLILFTNSPKLESSHNNVHICYNDYLDPNVTQQWMTNCFNFISNQMENF